MSSKSKIWDKCLQALESEISAHEYKIWILPLQAKMISDVSLVLFAPNKFVIEFVNKHFLSIIMKNFGKLSDNLINVELQVGSINKKENKMSDADFTNKNTLNIHSTKLNSANNRFKKYQSALNKEISFNTLLKGQKQLIMSYDTFQKEENGLEGALHRVIAIAHFQGKKISVNFTKLALHDLIASQDTQISIENIQKIVAKYYKIRVADLHSKRRTRSVARPRQIAMSLAKHLTKHSLPEIGDAFGGRDHTTVLYACRKIKELRTMEIIIEEDYINLYKQLTS